MFKFEEAVLANHGKYKQFIHGEFTDKLGPEFKKGACFALSTLFLSRFDKTQNTDQEIGPLKFTAATDHQKVIDLAKEIQARETVRSKKSKEVYKTIESYLQQIAPLRQERNFIASLDGLQQRVQTKEDVTPEDVKHDMEYFLAMDKRFKDVCQKIDDNIAEIKSLNAWLNENFNIGKMFLDALGAFGLKKNALTVDGAKWVLTDKIEDSLIQNNGRYLIVLPKHAVAVLISDAKWKFFDANFGQGVFTNANDFKHFLRTYLNDGDIKNVYKLENDKHLLFATAI